MDETAASWIIFIGFNLLLFSIARHILQASDMTAMLREKSVAAPAAPADPNVPAPDNTSYSRVSGACGSAVMVCFFWALSDIVIVKVFARSPNMTDIKTFVEGLSSYFLYGSALFAPYAFNQLSQAFKPKS